MKYFSLIITIVLIIGCGDYGEPEFKTAYIRKAGQNFIITIKGRASLHPASPFDVGKTVEDSFQFIVPRDTGIIKPNELPNDRGSYPWAGGDITIGDNKLKIELYFNDTDQKKIEADVWNKQYDLIRLK
jgi:hypothetical protein